MIEISLNQLLDNWPDEPGPRESKGSSGKSIKGSFRRPGCRRESAEPTIEFHCVIGKVTSITSQHALDRCSAEARAHEALEHAITGHGIDEASGISNECSTTPRQRSSGLPHWQTMASHVS